MFRYYSIQRPVSLGSFPKSKAVVEIKNFDERIFCEEIGKEAWGWVAYASPLTREEATEYGLVLAGTKSYYCVTTSVSNSGKVISAITSVIEADCKPENSFNSLRRGDIYNDWFDSREEAEEFVRESK